MMSVSRTGQGRIEERNRKSGVVEYRRRICRARTHSHRCDVVLIGMMISIEIVNKRAAPSAAASRPIAGQRRYRGAIHPDREQCATLAVTG